eukprot:symbB.v1.2.015797.t1/scaffold1190.1/size132987/6
MALQEVQDLQSQSPEGTPGRQKAPSFSWPGTSGTPGTSSTFTAEATHANAAMRKASVSSVSSVHQPSGPSLGRSRAVTEAPLDVKGMKIDMSTVSLQRLDFLLTDRGRDSSVFLMSAMEGGLAVRLWVQHQGTTLRRVVEWWRFKDGKKAKALRSLSNANACFLRSLFPLTGSETSSSESPEEAQVEHDLQELAARLHVPPAGRALGAGEEVECRPPWRRTIVDSELTMATE